MSLKVPRITTGSTTAVHATENTSVSETDLVEELGTNPITTISGASDLSRQLLDRSEPGMADVVLATELGLDLAADLDLQLLQGSGTSGQMLGLITVTGIGTTLYTDATATQQESFVQILKAASDQSVALGQAGDAILLHPRRRIWFSNWRDTAAGIPATIPWPAQLHDVPAIPTTAGAGTEDYALILRTDELPVYLGPVVFEVFPELNSAVGTVKARARQYASALFTRRPEAIMKVSGTGYIAPVYA
jgi:hypothetical protein